MGVVRVFGAFWVLGGCAMAFAQEVPVFFGPQAVARLRGWSKAWLVIPCVLRGACLWVYAPELTCWSTKYRHLCA